MQIVIALLLAVEQQERIDEQGQIVNQRDIERAIGFQTIGATSKKCVK
jgi:hypothetical protein